MISTDSFSTTRNAFLGLTALICFAYAALALITGRPDPIPFWIPGLAGFGSAAIIALAARVAGHTNASRANDEMYIADSRRAYKFSFWVALLMYPAFAVPLMQGWVSWPVAYAAMGTLTAAIYLAARVWFDLRGHA